MSATISIVENAVNCRNWLQKLVVRVCVCVVKMDNTKLGFVID